MKALMERLADHVEQFNCSVYDDGRLVLFPNPPVSGNQHKSIHVGYALKIAELDWRIVRLEPEAPDYLKPLVGHSFAGQNLLKAAVRRAAFVAAFEEICV